VRTLKAKKTIELLVQYRKLPQSALAAIPAPAPVVETLPEPIPTPTPAPAPAPRVVVPAPRVTPPAPRYVAPTPPPIPRNLINEGQTQDGNYTTGSGSNWASFYTEVATTWEACVRYYLTNYTVQWMVRSGTPTETERIIQVTWEPDTHRCKLYTEFKSLRQKEREDDAYTIEYSYRSIQVKPAPRKPRGLFRIR